MELLLGASCDAALLNNAGLTGWELAVELRRADVLTLRLGSHPPTALAAREETVQQPVASELKRLKQALRKAG